MENPNFQDGRGRFSGFHKWKTCRSFETGPKYVVCNADEGEPGTFKDRFLLMEYPELVVEGMILAGFVIRAKEGVLYLRAEYKYLKKRHWKGAGGLPCQRLAWQLHCRDQRFQF
ncbi:MAG: hypothetical protein IPJ40_02145 [Saprospirales bacterium]|nr:hypothetical protein [Saprospirales bacterium]